MKELRFALFGAGFWSRCQLAGWRELPGVRCAAVCDLSRPRAEALAGEFGVPAVYDDPEELFRRERIDFADVVTSPDTHAELVHLAARRRTAVICQKPMAPSLAAAEGMVRACREAGVPLLVHENWRWQAPIREVRRLLDAGRIGRPFRARIEFSCSFPVFDNQPFLKELPEFILADVGVHLLDTARFLFGEADRLYAQTRRVRPDIRGEDVATVILRTRENATVVCALSYASRLERERFPETFLLAEGDSGSIELAPGGEIRVTTAGGTESTRHPPPAYAWVDPAYGLVQAAIVPCQAHLLAALRGEAAAETTGEDNLRTLRLVFGAYASARDGRAVEV